jgi:uncharacterized membrane protein
MRRLIIIWIVIMIIHTMLMVYHYHEGNYKLSICSSFFLGWSMLGVIIEIIENHD